MNEFYVYLLGFKHSREIPNNMTCLDILQVSQDPNLYSKNGCFQKTINL